MTVTGHNSLSLFESKIEEAVALVPGMSPDEKLKCVHFWNNVSGKLQDLVNSGATDITALAQNKDEKSIYLKDCELSRNADCDNFFSVEYFSSNSSCTSSEPTGNCINNKLIVTQNENSSFCNSIPITSEGSSLTLIGTAFDNTSGNHCQDGITVNDISCDKKCFNSDIQNDCTISQLTNGCISNCSVNVKRTNEIKATKDNSLFLLASNDAKSVNDSYLLQLLANSSEDSVKDLEFELENISPVDVSIVNSDDKESISPVSKVDRHEAKRMEIPDGGSTSDNIPTFTCDWCDQSFSDDVSLNSHRKCHTKPFFCTECEAQFSCKGNLMVHFRKHTGEKPFPCSVCSAHFSTQGNLKRHLRSHMGVRPHKCIHCGSCFTEKKSLIVHMRRHTGEKPYQCDICRKQFSQSGILQSHMSVHLNERLHLCEYCGKAFRQKSQLRIHMMRHEGVRKYSCKQCAARFLIKGDLERHERMHTGERPYVCDLCHKSFTRQQSLKEHHNRHYGLKPFKCKYCSKTFPEMSACYKHVKQHERLKTDDISMQVADAGDQAKSSTQIATANIKENSISIHSSASFSVIYHDYDPQMEDQTQFEVESKDAIETS